VFYKNGWETMVLRPGFSGKVDHFGMLIPFPTPPAVRKVPENIFEHIAHAIDPPDFVVTLGKKTGVSRSSSGGGALGARSGQSGLKIHLGVDEIQVISEEAIGMYEVAVLRSGSNDALERWLSAHQYKYPKGMEKSCEEYVKQKWCFVAVKAKIGRKLAVAPKPGQRDVDPKLPRGTTFDGHVQAMGFRFRSPRLVVPMRLSALNPGKLHNVVYLLSDRPARIAQLSKKFVVRQIPGEELYKNFSKPLPLRLDGGQRSDVPPLQWRALQKLRDPTNYVASAKDLFASDLLCAATGQTSFEHEVSADRLRAIGNQLGLRGRGVDKAVSQFVQVQHEAVARRSLAGLKKMTLTVIDGVFPRDVLAKQNLTFLAYDMPNADNSSDVYDAKSIDSREIKAAQNVLPAMQRGAPVLMSRIPVVGSIEGENAADNLANVRPTISADRTASTTSWSVSLLLTIPTVALGLLLVRRKRRRLGQGMFIAAFCFLALGATEQFASAQTIQTQIRRLAIPSRAAEAADQLVAKGDKAVDALVVSASRGKQIDQRGWSIVCLSRIGGPEASKSLTRLYHDPKQSALLRMWAAAARLKMTATLQEVLALESLPTEIPATKALWRDQFMKFIERDEKTVPAEVLFKRSQLSDVVGELLAPLILQRGADELVGVMLTSQEGELRLQAAGYLGAMEQRGGDGVPQAVIEAFRFQADAKQTPWHGGPLYVPGLDWNGETARGLVGELIAWHVWSDIHREGKRRVEINNTLTGATGLTNLAGLKQPSGGTSTTAWLRAWKDAVGVEKVRTLLAAQGAEKRYAAALRGPKAK
jgi:hypothetical protein